MDFILDNFTEYERRLSSGSTNEGFAYYAFYAQNNCGGTVSYTSGIPANVCLPGTDYDFGGNYYYYSAIRAYKSFMLMNINGKFNIYLFMVYSTNTIN